jgi:hypothetical protein
MPVPFCLTKNHADNACQLSQFKLDHLHKLHQFKLELCKLNYKLLRAQFENESKPVCVLGWNVIEHDNVT